MSYRTEFPDFSPETMPDVPAEWVDESWRNDGCPSFAVPPLADGSRIRVYIDYASPKERFADDCRRFGVVLESDAGEHDVATTEQWSEALAAVRLMQSLAAPKGA